MSHGLLADSVDTTLASLLYSCTTDALCCSMKCTISERAEKDVRSWRAKQHVHSFTRPICKQEVVLLHAVWSALSAILHVVLPPSVCLSLCTVTLCIVALRVGILGAESCTVVFLAGIFLFPSWDTFDVECSRHGCCPTTSSLVFLWAMTVCVSMQKQMCMDSGHFPCGSHDWNMSIYVSICRTWTMSFWISTSFNMSRFRLRSLLVTQQIFLNTDISRTPNFIFCFSLSVQVSEL